MAARENPGTVVIRRQKVHDSGHHSGSWKVAFADFAIAMMALFLVLWLISATTSNQKKAIASYFSAPGLFNHTGSMVAIELQGATSLINSAPFFLKPGAFGITGLNVSNQGLRESKKVGNVQVQEFLQFTQTIAEGKAAKKSQEVVIPKSVLLSLVSSMEGPMFPPDSYVLNPFYEDLLIALAPTLAELQLKLIISGHTDSKNASPISDSENIKWSLSSQRAEAIREVLVFSGVPPKQILQLVAMADTLPLNKVRPDSHLNRRVDIMVLPKRGEQFLKRNHEASKKIKPISEKDLKEAIEKAQMNTYEK